MNNIRFVKTKSKVISNLYVAFDGPTPVGMVHKPKDSKTDKNFWRSYVGIGENARFLGHSANRNNAQSLVLWAHMANNATVQVIENRTGLQIF